MASSDRARSLDEARSDRPPPSRRRARRDRARVLPSDPVWLHEGTTLQLTLRGQAVDFFGISVVAAGVGKSTGTIRRWIEQGLLPEPPYRTPGRLRCAQHRLWRREEVLAMAATVQELGLRGRRPRRWAGSPLPERLRVDVDLR
jgi:hypothetical protein